eukprot:gnl/TRDRNA2_/TRDRNA2_116060_c0_seq2.p2 gnl/TRDRNA2_/TRDRNA2_116060_c0~~gnl/TRDRNA2_/TRDRNA2_116060_c0_seq2.p2  ORF type:complete len:139 (-),score=7.65 gnl/TRDRNA2_/TRDRNA2_116060_c0_seq2:242-658(-)
MTTMVIHADQEKHSGIARSISHGMVSQGHQDPRTQHTTTMRTVSAAEEAKQAKAREGGVGGSRTSTKAVVRQGGGPVDGDARKQMLRIRTVSLCESHISPCQQDHMNYFSNSQCASIAGVCRPRSGQGTNWRAVTSWI